MTVFFSSPQSIAGLEEFVPQAACPAGGAVLSWATTPHSHVQGRLTPGQHVPCRSQGWGGHWLYCHPVEPSSTSPCFTVLAAHP